MECNEIRQQLPAYSGEGEMPLEVRRHLSRCAECSAQWDRYAELAVSLDSLKAVTIDPPPLLARSLSAIAADRSRVETVRTHVTRNRRAYLGAAALLAAGAGAAAWRARSARLATA